MATVAIATEKLARGSHQWKWETLLQGDVGGVLDEKQGSVNFPDKTVSITGTYGGATLVIEGSNDNVTFVTLHDTFDVAATSAISVTAGNHVLGILESPRYIRPNVTGGDGTTDFDVIIVGRATMQLR